MWPVRKVRSSISPRTPPFQTKLKYERLARIFDTDASILGDYGSRPEVTEMAVIPQTNVMTTATAVHSPSCGAYRVRPDPDRASRAATRAVLAGNAQRKVSDLSHAALRLYRSRPSALAPILRKAAFAR